MTQAQMTQADPQARQVRAADPLAGRKRRGPVATCELTSEPARTTHGPHNVVRATIRQGVDLVVGNVRLAIAGEHLFLYARDVTVQITPHATAIGLLASVLAIAPPDQPARLEPLPADRFAGLPLVSVGQGDTRRDVFPKDL
ncbi:MAG: hypothetical protein BWX88_02674 [Planctomycetes bacterium ADurb.Bin126]|nr:MAG: hypothetical protein BWX88_02674 [Planctomycetes bacterium ADurb.Bin126]HOD79975.1 hypothetical protein [Phycisphaerae bacterium]HQL74032.1 hypothetical protein [Phycisphaerae bacterium]